jgi:mono/diheme cytochrome c family protein
VAVALAAAGCGAVGRVTQGDPAHGKELFLASTPKGSCASCHTLADAKSQGTIGPNLDDAFSSDKSQGFSQQTMADIVRGQIAYPEKPMPANLVRGKEANDVATYVAQCSGNAKCGVTAAKPAPATTAPAPTTTSGPSQGGGGGNAQLAAGKKVFETAGCSGCHTLADAGAKGTVGPDLDTLKPDEATVAHQVENGGGAMPAFKGTFSDAEIQAVAVYVSHVAGQS